MPSEIAALTKYEERDLRTKHHAVERAWSKAKCAECGWTWSCDMARLFAMLDAVRAGLG